MERNEITEDWLRKEISCNVCKGVEVVLVDPHRWEAYKGGSMVQEVWPEASPAYREQMIGLRSGYHVCDTCWGPSLGGDEFDEEIDE